MTLGFLLILHRYLMVACENPCPDEEVRELRRRRRQVGELISDFRDERK